MLKSLKIKNIALIEDLLIEFDEGLNVLTGETGAGKSIIIDSLSFVLGARSDKTLIRQGQTSARVEAIFDSLHLTGEAKQVLNNLDIDENDGLMIVRTMSLDGKSDTKINGSPVTLTILRKITSSLVDIYGQQEQVALMNTRNQLELLDSFGTKTIKPVLDEYKQLNTLIKEVNSKLDQFGGDDQNYEREKDYLKYVIKEIEDADISVSEEQTLLEDKTKLANIEKVMSLTATVENGVYSALPAVSQSLSALASAVQFDQNLGPIHSRLESVKLELDDIGDYISSYNRNDNFSERDLDKIEERLDQYKNLKRKYGSTCDDVLQFLESSKQKLYELENREEIRLDLLKEKQEFLGKIFVVASRLTKQREIIAKQLCEKIKDVLKNLGMPSCQVQFDFKNTELLEQNLTSKGIGQVEILFNANLGGALNPLNKVASGGELSRFMLAVKSIVSQNDSISTMVFDEIDTGISGKMAQAMSEKMTEISKYNQVLSITHTVQIASMADTHFLIKKKEENGKTISTVEKLTYEQRVEEISRFISGGELTPSSVAMAKELLANQQNYRKTTIWHFL